MGDPLRPLFCVHEKEFLVFPSRQRLRTIYALALPIIGGMLSQNVLNIVDTLMVGSLGNQALAAVGIASFAHFFCTAFITGIASGVQAITSRRVGEKRWDEAATALNGGLLSAWLVGVPLAILLYQAASWLVPLLANDTEVAAIGVPYLEARFWGLVPLAMNYSFRGYFNGVRLSKIYFRTIVGTHLANVVLNYLFIYGNFGFPELGAVGAGRASALAFWFGSALYFVQASRLARENGFLKCLPSAGDLRALVRLALPTGIQQTFFAGGMMTFFAILARVGTAEVAASNVLVNLLLVVILPSIGFGLAGATLVGQALGEGDTQGARAWGADVVTVAAATMTLVGLVGALFPEWLLSPFFEDQATRHLAEAPLRLIACSLPVDAVGLVLMQCMLGAGHARRVMWITIGLQWGLQLPLVFLAALVFQQSLTVIWAMHFSYRAVQTSVLWLEWRRGAWQDVAV